MIIREIWEENEQERPDEKILIKRDEAETIELGYISVDSGAAHKEGFHEDEEEIYVVLKGRAILRIGNEEKEVSEGSVAYVPRNTKHNMICISEEKLEYLYFANWPDSKR